MVTFAGLQDSTGVRWRDYVGEAVADDAMALPGQPSLYELAHVDRAIWQIVGLEFVQRRDGLAGAKVFVVDRGETGARPDERRDGQGEIQVVAIKVSDGIAELMQNAFEAISVRLVSEEWAGESLRIVQTVEQADHPL